MPQSKKVGEGRGRQFKGHGGGRGVPGGAGEEAGRRGGAIDELGIAGERVQIDQRADGVAGDLRGHGMVLFDVGPIVSRYAA